MKDLKQLLAEYRGIELRTVNFILVNDPNSKLEEMLKFAEYVIAQTAAEEKSHSTIEYHQITSLDFLVKLLYQEHIPKKFYVLCEGYYREHSREDLMVATFELNMGLINTGRLFYSL